MNTFNQVSGNEERLTGEKGSPESRSAYADLHSIKGRRVVVNGVEMGGQLYILFHRSVGRDGYMYVLTYSREHGFCNLREEILNTAENAAPSCITHLLTDLSDMGIDYEHIHYGLARLLPGLRHTHAYQIFDETRWVTVSHTFWCIDGMMAYPVITRQLKIVKDPPAGEKILSGQISESGVKKLIKATRGVFGGTGTRYRYPPRQMFGLK